MSKTTVCHVKSQLFDVYIGREMPGLTASVFANPYKVGRDGTRQECIDKYRQYVLGRPNLLKRLPELRGKRLACWCHPRACHGDVLVELLGTLETGTLKLSGTLEQYEQRSLF